MKTATGTKTDDDADRTLRDRRGMRLVPRSEKKKAPRLTIGIADDMFAIADRRPAPVNSEGHSSSPADRALGSDSSASNAMTKNLALAATVGLIVGLLLSRRDR